MRSEIASTILSTSIYVQWHTRRCVSHDREPSCFTIVRFYFFLSRVRDHFRISLYCASSERQTARDRRHGINIDLRILPWSITREMTLARLATIRLPGKSETLTVCYQIAERRRTVDVCVPRDTIAHNFFSDEMKKFRIKMYVGFGEIMFSRYINTCYSTDLWFDLRHFLNKL